MTTYRWKSGARYKGSAQQVGERLQALVEIHSDRLTARVVVDDARADTSVLHQLFEWDDVRAAEKYREDQARHVLRSVVVIKEDEAPVQMFVNVVEMVGEDEQHAYVTTARAFSDAALTSQVLQAARREIETFKTKYRQFEALADIAEDAGQKIDLLMEQQQPA